MGVILILGRDEDPCCRLVHDQLAACGRDVLLLPEDRLFPGLSFAWRPGSGPEGRVEYDGRRVDFASIDAILSRAWGVPVTADDFETTDGRYVCAEWNALLVAWLHEMPCTVVNRLKPEVWYKAQLNAADLAALLPEMPLKLPRSIVTTNGEDAIAFCRSAQGPVRYSPLTRVSQYRVKTDADHDELVSLSRTLPLYLTEWIDGEAIDAFVVGSDVIFSARNERFNGGGRPAAFRHCLDVANTLGLTFCKLSLVEASNGDWYCFDLDRAPLLGHRATALQLEVTRAIARVLSAADRVG
jgi:hypothetical protein